ncbi:DUF6894 family protein [Microvirga massiliensis]|uniref:DUF6894 family protein n=1 Tax=Microvirga massiliensis TaxID=1033741 RepID=UPI000ABCDC75|nr:hypothetical protein [Microvirga massiliensis]
MAIVLAREAQCPAITSIPGKARGSSPHGDGLEVKDLDADEYEAMLTAAEIARDRLPKGEARDVSVEVRNEHHQPVLTVRISMEVERVGPPPEPSRVTR